MQTREAGKIESAECAAAPLPSRRRVLFLVTEDWYFLAHRRSLARAARDAGYEVIVATRVDRCGAEIEQEGFTLVPLRWKRGTLNPLRLAAELIEIARTYHRLKPDILHHVSLKPIVVGSLANLLVRRGPSVNALTGLGFVFVSPRTRERILVSVLAWMLGRTLNRPKTVTLLENEDDRLTVMDRFGLAKAQTEVNRGSGVDTRLFAPLPLPEHPVPSIACCARMVKTKGVEDLVAASQILLQAGLDHRLILAGDPDPENPNSISHETLTEWAKRPNIQWLGHVGDVRKVWAEAAIAVLASHGGEGVPLSLVEAAACGRPIVATDVPGCRDIVEDGHNGFLVPPRDPSTLADRLAVLLREPALRRRMAAASLAVVEQGFSSDVVNARTLSLYGSLLRGYPTARRGGSGG